MVHLQLTINAMLSFANVAAYQTWTLITLKKNTEYEGEMQTAATQFVEEIH
jgi:hypothetical protein